MSNIAKGLVWAFALLLIAAGRRYGLIEARMAQTLLMIVPIVALLSLRGERAGQCDCARAGHGQRA
jgi:uncharacterized membrane protein (UPF0136 family)